MDMLYNIRSNTLSFCIAFGGTIIGCIGLYQTVNNWRLRQQYKHLGIAYKNRCRRRLDELKCSMTKVRLILVHNSRNALNVRSRHTRYTIQETA